MAIFNLRETKAHPFHKDAANKPIPVRQFVWEGFAVKHAPYKIEGTSLLSDWEAKQRFVRLPLIVAKLLPCCDVMRRENQPVFCQCAQRFPGATYTKPIRQIIFYGVQQPKHGKKTSSMASSITALRAKPSEFVIFGLFNTLTIFLPDTGLVVDKKIEATEQKHYKKQRDRFNGLPPPNHAGYYL